LRPSSFTFSSHSRFFDVLPHSAEVRPPLRSLITPTWTAVMKRLLKWTGILLGSFAGLAVIFLVATYFISEAKLNETYQIAVAPIEVPSDSATIARGHHLLQILSCQECHGDDLSGKVFVDAPPF